MNHAFHNHLSTRDRSGDNAHRTLDCLDHDQQLVSRGLEGWNRSEKHKSPVAEHFLEAQTWEDCDSMAPPCGDCLFWRFTAFFLKALWRRLLLVSPSHIQGIQAARCVQI